MSPLFKNSPWLGLALLVASCSGPPGWPDSGFPLSQGEGILLARLVSWPAGGAELTVRLEDDDGFPMTGDRSADLALSWNGGSTAEPIAAVKRAPAEAGHTLILFIPGQTLAEQSEIATALDSFISSRPTGERIALYRWSTTIDQLANFTTDTAMLGEVLARTGPRDGGIQMAAPELALSTAVAEVRRVDNDTMRGMRSVVIVGDKLQGPAPEGLGRPVVTQWALGTADQAAVDSLGAGRVVRWSDHGGPAGALDVVAARLAAFGDAFYDLGVCGVGDGGRIADITLAGDDAYLTVSIAASPPEDRFGTCDRSRIVGAPRDYPETIDFAFTPGQRAAYDDITAGNSRADFDLSVRFWPEGPWVSASAHLHGKGSIGCERRSYTLNLDSNQARYLLPDSATDEFYLISLCLDNRYIRAYTAYQLSQRMGVFPLEFRYVELTLDGDSRGAYLLLEKTSEALVSGNSRVRSVIRRRYSPDMTVPEVKYSVADPGEVTAAYDDLLASLGILSGEELVEELDERMDSRGYLTLLALNSLLQNGDNVDEVWMMSTERLRADGQVGDWFSFVAWDPDDIFAGCHYSGRYAYVDEFELTYCAEAELDDVILADPLTYARYVDRLDELLATVTDEVFAELLGNTEAALLPLVRRPEVAAAMVELIADNPAAVDPAVAEQEIVDAIADLDARFRARRQLLLQRVANYRAQTTP